MKKLSIFTLFSIMVVFNIVGMEKYKKQLIDQLDTAENMIKFCNESKDNFNRILSKHIKPNNENAQEKYKTDFNTLCTQLRKIICSTLIKQFDSEQKDWNKENSIFNTTYSKHLTNIFTLFEQFPNIDHVQCENLVEYAQLIQAKYPTYDKLDELSYDILNFDEPVVTNLPIYSKFVVPMVQEGHTLLSAAVSHGPLEPGMVNTLLAAGADPNQKCLNPHLSTPLMIAVGRNRIAIVTALLEAPNINLLITNYYGQNALHCAVEKNRKEIAKMLLTKDPNEAHINAKNNRGDTPLDIAVSKNNLTIMKLFITSKNNTIEIKPAYFDNAIATLKITKKTNAAEEIRRTFGYLLNHRSINKAYKNALLIKALEHNLSKIAQMLIEKGADIYALNTKNQNAIFYIYTKPESQHKKWEQCKKLIMSNASYGQALRCFMLGLQFRSKRSCFLPVALRMTKHATYRLKNSISRLGNSFKSIFTFNPAINKNF